MAIHLVEAQEQEAHLLVVNRVQLMPMAMVFLMGHKPITKVRQGQQWLHLVAVVHQEEEVRLVALQVVAVQWPRLVLHLVVLQIVLHL